MSNLKWLAGRLFAAAPGTEPDQPGWTDIGATDGGVELPPYPRLPQVYEAEELRGRPWASVTADVHGDVQEAMRQIYDAGFERAILPPLAEAMLPPSAICPAHMREMVREELGAWFRCPEISRSGEPCRFVLTDESRRRDGEVAYHAEAMPAPADEFTGAMTEREHRRIRREMGLDADPEFDDEPDQDPEDYPQPRERRQRGTWVNREHP